MKIPFLLSMAMILLSANVSAFTESTGTVHRLVCHDNSVSPICHIDISGSLNVADCVDSSWEYSFISTTDEGKNLLSILLAAQLSSKPVTLAGKGTCLVAGGTEDLRHAYITTP